jgi:hypothetical protein
MGDALSHPEKWSRWGVDAPDEQTMWYNSVPLFVRGRQFVRHEPERSRRVLRLLVANTQSQCDRPRPARAKMRDHAFLLYASNEFTSSAIRALGPEELQQWLLGSDLRGLLAALSLALSRRDGDLAAFDLPRLDIAARAYRLDGGVPPTTYGDLVGPYIKTLPDGFEHGDALAPNAEPLTPTKPTP